MFEKWCILKEPEFGPELINIDFNAMNLTDFHLTADAWNSFVNNLKTLLLTPIKATALAPLFELLDLPDLNADSILATHLRIIHDLVPPRGRTIIGEKHYKPSVVDSKDSMICVVMTDDLTVTVQKRRDAVKKINQPLQPFIIVQDGRSDCNCSKTTRCCEKN